MRVGLDLRLCWRDFDSGWGCVCAASTRGGAASARLRLVLRSERASTGRLGGAAAPVLGLWLAVGARILRLRVPSVDLPPSERSRGGRSTASGSDVGSASPFPWHGPREGRSAAHPTPKGTQDSSFVRPRSNASALVTGSHSKRRSLGVPAHERRSLRPTEATAREPEPPPAKPPGQGLFGDHPQRKPRQRTSKVATPRGSAPASPDPLRQRTSKPRPPAAAHQQAQTPAAAHHQAPPTSENHHVAAPRNHDTINVTLVLTHSDHRHILAV